jgi:hypothetical protein
MRTAAFVIAAAGLLAATSAVAAGKFTDIDYLKANRCRAIAASAALGPMDTQAIDALLKAQGRSRTGAVEEMAQREQVRARREAANPERKARLEAELKGPCTAYMEGARAPL